MRPSHLLRCGGLCFSARKGSREWTTSCARRSRKQSRGSARAVSPSDPCSSLTDGSSGAGTTGACRRVARFCMPRWIAWKTPAGSLRATTSGRPSTRRSRPATCAAAQRCCTRFPRSSSASISLFGGRKTTCARAASSWKSSTPGRASSSCTTSSPPGRSSGTRTSAHNLAAPPWVACLRQRTRPPPDGWRACGQVGEESRSVQIILEPAAAAGMAQLAQRLRLDLADALARDLEFPAHLFERATAAIVQPKAQTQHLLLALGQPAERVLHLLFEELVAGRVGWGQRAVVLDEIAQVAVVFLANRRLEADRLLADLDDLAHLFGRDLHLLGDLLGGGLAALLLQQAPADANQAVDGLDHVHGNRSEERRVGKECRSRWSPYD